MNLKVLFQKFIDQAKAKDVFGAMKTAAELLNKVAGTGELLFGAAEAEDLTAEESALYGLKSDMLAGCGCEAKDGSCKTVEFAADGEAKFDPTPLSLGLVDVLLKLIAERRKNKPSQ